MKPAAPESAKQRKWFELVLEYRRSGKSQVVFAKERNISLATLRYWSARVPEQSPNAFARVVVEQPREMLKARLRLPSGAELELSDGLAIVVVERLLSGKQP